MKRESKEEEKLREEEMERMKSDAKVIIKDDILYMRIRMGGQGRELTSNDLFSLFYP